MEILEKELNEIREAANREREKICPQSISGKEEEEEKEVNDIQK